MVACPPCGALNLGAAASEALFNRIIWVGHGDETDYSDESPVHSISRQMQ